MTGTILVIPAEGACVRQPERFGEPVPATGAAVPDTSYYRRFIATGDLAERDLTPPSAPAEDPPAALAQRRGRAAAPSPHTDQE